MTKKLTREELDARIADTESRISANVVTIAEGQELIEQLLRDFVQAVTPDHEMYDVIEKNVIDLIGEPS